MKYAFYFVFFMLFSHSFTWAQNVEIPEERTIGVGTVEGVSGSIGTINVNINPTDSVDIEALDSILKTLQTAFSEEVQESKIYGHEILKNDSIKVFQPSTILKIPDDYILGVGDEIVVSIFGISQFDGKWKINNEGFIQPTEMPKIFLKGLTWVKARQLMSRRFSNYYRFRSEQFSATITDPRMIVVNIFGEVKQPGSYSLVATNTAFNALIRAGGINESGSVRNIKVITGREESILDIYDLMSNPSVQLDFYLEDQAVIQVPVVKKLVEITGAVQRPLFYELEETEGLVEALDFAGGLSPNAVRTIIQVTRYIEDQQIIVDVNLEEILQQGQSFELRNGDKIDVRAIKSDAPANAVYVRGAVQLPGVYSIETTPRVSDLVSKAVLKMEARTDIAMLLRMNADSTVQLIEVDLAKAISNSGSLEDLALNAQDALVISSRAAYVDRSNISITGAVRTELELPFDPNSSVSLSQAIFVAEGLAPDAKDVGYIVRTNPNNQKEKEYIEVDIKEALLNEGSPTDILLRPWDKVVVLSSESLSDALVVSVKGHVRYPESFDYDESLDLKKLITLAGGLRREASRKLIVYRLKIGQNQTTKTIAIPVEIDENYELVNGPTDFRLEPNDEVVIHQVSEYESQSFVRVLGEVLYPGPYALISDNETLQSLITRAGGLTTEAFPQGVYVQRVLYRKKNEEGEVLPYYHRVITNFDGALNGSSSGRDLILKEGDIIILPKKVDVINIRMAGTKAFDINPEEYRNGQIKVKYEAGKSAKWYIEQYAGGFGYRAEKKSVVVRYANGAVKRSSGGLFRKYPVPKRGATISIQLKSEFADSEEEDSDLDQQKNVREGVIITVGTDGSIEQQAIDSNESNN